MGTSCFLNPQNSFYENSHHNNKIISKQKLVPSMKKAIKIQSSFRGYIARKIFKNNIEILSQNLINQFENKKLLNIEVITNSKSEKYYQKLLAQQKIKSYSEYITKNPKIISKLKIIAKYSVNISYYIVNSSNEAYRGSWNFNKKYNGYGVIYQFDISKNKEKRIEGIFNNGILNGYGRIIISDEEMIRGDFAFNKLNGLGEYHRKDGSIYTGAFYSGYPQGNGRETFKDGSFFEGYYFKGQKKYGKFVFKDKNYYEGYFENDVFHGQGKYKWGDKKMYEGYWKEGKINGKGKLTYSDGSYYEGDLVNGLKEGKGKYVWKGNYYYIGEWKNDIQNGYGVFYKNGQKIRGFWENGKIKSEASINSTCILRKRMHSTDKIKVNLNKNRNIRFTYTDNIQNISKITGDKKSEVLYGKTKTNEEDIENNCIRSSFGSVYSINSNTKKEENDIQQ